MITYEHLQELQRFAELGRMSASLLHEISNPLTAAMLNLELTDEKSAGVRRARRDMRLMRRYIEAARQQVRRQSRITNFSVQPQLDQLKRVLLPLARQAGIRLDMAAPPACRLRGDPVKFQHIVSNLVVNAIEASRNGDLKDESSPVRVIFTIESNWLILRVTDCGTGIPADALPHLFETFYTTKPGRGLGIGLAIVKHYVTADFGGTIDASTSDCTGTCFTVKLPLCLSA